MQHVSSFDIHLDFMLGESSKVDYFLVVGSGLRIELCASFTRANAGSALARQYHRSEVCVDACLIILRDI